MFKIRDIPKNFPPVSNPNARYINSITQIKIILLNPTFFTNAFCLNFSTYFYLHIDHITKLSCPNSLSLLILYNRIVFQSRNCITFFTIKHSRNDYFLIFLHNKSHFNFFMKFLVFMLFLLYNNHIRNN